MWLQWLQSGLPVQKPGREIKEIFAYLNEKKQVARRCRILSGKAAAVQTE